MAEQVTHNPHLLSTEEAAAYIGCTPGTLCTWRCTGAHKIPFLRIGRKIRYEQSDLDKWLEQHKVNAVD